MKTKYKKGAYGWTGCTLIPLYGGWRLAVTTERESVGGGRYCLQTTLHAEHVKDGIVSFSAGILDANVKRDYIEAMMKSAATYSRITEKSVRDFHDTALLHLDKVYMRDVKRKMAEHYESPDLEWRDGAVELAKALREELGAA